MARATFGGGIADFVTQSIGGGIVKFAPATLSFYSAKTGGTRYSDLLLGGSAASTISVGTDGQVPQFQGPDGVFTMWADGGGARVQMVAVADAVALATAPTDATVATAINTPGGATATALATSIGQRLARSVAFNVLDYGAVGDGVADDTAAITNAIVAATTLSSRPLVRIPRGVYKVNGGLRMYTGLTIQGDGRGNTILRSVDTHGPVFWAPVGGATGSSAAAPLTNMLFRDFDIDGYQMTLPGGYYTAAKGFIGQYFRNCVWENVGVYGTPASGFGVDFLDNCWFIACHAEDCGRLNDGSNPGGAGFGIGTGGFANEHHELVGCVAINNGTFGYFAERQDGGGSLFASYGKIRGGHFENNRIANIANAGAKRWSVIGATSHGSQYGIAFMPRLTDSLGFECIVADVIQAGASSHGFHLTYPQNTQSGRLTLQIHGGQYGFNGGDGIHLDTVAGQTLTAVDILDPFVHENNGAGVRFAGPGTVQRFLVRAHAISNGKGAPASAVASAGVSLDCGAVSFGQVTQVRAYDLNGAGAKNQKYGVAFAPTCVASHVQVFDNSLVGNGTDAILPPAAAGSAQNSIERNDGYNPRGVTATTLGASPAIYTAGVTPEVVNIIGGTVSLIEIADYGGTYATYATSGGSFPLRPGQSARVTYSAAPTAVKIARA